MQQKKLILYSCLFFSSVIFAQDKTIVPSSNKLRDLHLTLAKAPNDTLKLAAMEQILVYHSESNIDSALYYTKQIVPIAQKLKFYLFESRLQSAIGYFEMRLGNYSAALEAHLSALKISGSEQATENIIPSFFPFIKDNNPQIIRALKFADQTNTYGLLYGAVGYYKKEVANYKTTKNIFTKYKYKRGLAYVNMNLGAVYLRQKQYKKAINHLETAYDQFTGEEGNLYHGTILNNIGQAYYEQANFAKSKATFLKAIQKSKAQNNINSLHTAENNLAVFYLDKGEFDTCITYARRVIDNEHGLYLPSQLATSFKQLSAAYQAKNVVDSAYHYLKLAKTLQDSLTKVRITNLGVFHNTLLEENLRNRDLEQARNAQANRRRTYVLLAALGFLSIIGLLLFRHNKQQQKSNRALSTALAKVKSTQTLLANSEKMALLGQLTGGIAHEIQNPLNFVNNFSEVSTELLEELQEEVAAGNMEEVLEITEILNQNLEKIHHHGGRASDIVKNMLAHSGARSNKKESIDINALCTENLRLAYHGMRSKDRSFNADFETNFEQPILQLNIVPTDIGRALLNLINNAFYATNKKRKKGLKNYEPKVIVSTKKETTSANKEILKITVKDNGIGIPKDKLDKIFQPFFTTKPTGEGTGLGLSLSYDLAQTHGWTLTVESEVGAGTCFRIGLPLG